MRMRLTDPRLGDLIFEKNLPENYATELGMEQSETEINHAMASALVSDVWFDGVHLSYGEVQLHTSLTVKAECDTPVIEMHFGLTGNSDIVMVGNHHKMKFGAGQHNICYMPEFEGYLKADLNNEVYKMLEIHISEKYFKRFSNSESTLMDRFHDHIAKKQSSTLGPDNLSITLPMNNILQDIMNCKRQGVMKRMFVEARMLDLLMLQMEQFDSSVKPVRTQQIKTADMEKLQYAKFLIEQNISKPSSLTALSRAVGLNDFKLKKGFKEAFGMTVFGYLHELRMQEARRLLRDGSKSIHDVSDYCGYAYVQHFTTAFRNKFGVTPGSYRE